MTCALGAFWFEYGQRKKWNKKLMSHERSQDVLISYKMWKKKLPTHHGGGASVWLCLPSAGPPSKRTRITGWRRWWSGTFLDFTKNQRWDGRAHFAQSPPHCNQSLCFLNGRSLFARCPSQGLKKPYNPIIGETFRCMWLHQKTNSKTFYIAEQVTAARVRVWKAFFHPTHTQTITGLILLFDPCIVLQVSHHPPVSALYVSNRKDGFCLSGSILAKSKFYGRSHTHSQVESNQPVHRQVVIGKKNLTLFAFLMSCMKNEYEVFFKLSLQHSPSYWTSTGSAAWCPVSNNVKEFVLSFCPIGNKQQNLKLKHSPFDLWYLLRTRRRLLWPFTLAA